MSRYTFGDDASASERLRLVADAYRPVSRLFVSAHAPRPVGVALDLGCGPAFSTELLRDVCRPATLVGLDGSDSFVEAARERVPGARFETHDVSVTPLPGAPADLIYSRLLLAHLADPVDVVRSWRSQLRPGGRLLIEDLESVIDPPGPLRDYEEVSALVVRSGSGPMYAGTLLAQLGGSTARVTVPGDLAARIYLFNVRRWLAAPDLPFPEHRLQELEADLTGIVTDHQGTEVSWVVRQLSLPA
jgi:trans-aconitate 2-methyltransferase